MEGAGAGEVTCYSSSLKQRSPRGKKEGVMLGWDRGSRGDCIFFRTVVAINKFKDVLAINAMIIIVTLAPSSASRETAGICRQEYAGRNTRFSTRPENQLQIRST